MPEDRMVAGDNAGVSPAELHHRSTGPAPTRTAPTGASPGGASATGKAGRSSTVRTPSRDVETALIDAAERVLVRDGPEAVTVRAVAVEAGVAPMGVYNRFGGKDGLVDALLTRGFDGLRAAVAEHGETDPVERLLGSGLRYRDYALGHPAHYLAMFAGAIHQDAQSPDVLLCAGGSFEELVGHVRYGQVAGVLLADDPVEVAQQIWSTVHGAVQLEIKGMLQVPDADRAYRNLLDLLLRGLRVRPAH
ncbi:MAG: TetR/AcrR family transcriptional regulator [Nakamurella sp.]